MIELLNENITFDKISSHEIDKVLDTSLLTSSQDEMLDALEIIKGARVKEIDQITKEVNELNKVIKRLEYEKTYIEDRQKMFVPEGTEYCTGVHKFSWTSSKSVEILDITKIPIDLKTSKTTTNADKNAIKKAIENNQDIPGAIINTNWFFKTSLK